MARRKRREPETATINAVTHDGRGIADADGKKAFVVGALEGETVTFLRRKAHRNFDEAELLEIHTPSPDRIEARCAAYDRCGGCSLQHVSVEQQRRIALCQPGECRRDLQRQHGRELIPDDGRPLTVATMPCSNFPA